MPDPPGAQPPGQWAPLDEIYNFRRVDDDVITGGHPTAEQIRNAADEGFGAVVNLAPIDHRSVPDEDALVGSLGMAYHHIPVIWDAFIAEIDSTL